MEGLRPTLLRIFNVVSSTWSERCQYNLLSGKHFRSHALEHKTSFQSLQN